MLFIVTILIFMGLNMLCVSLDYSYKKLFSFSVNRINKQLFFILGWSSLLLSISLCLLFYETILALTIWFGITSLFSFVIAIFYSYIPQGILAKEDKID